MPRIGVFVYHCGKNIAGSVDVKKVVDVISKHLDVVHTEDYVYMCSDVRQKLVRERIREKKLDGLVMANCTPILHQKTFRNATAHGALMIVNKKKVPPPSGVLVSVTNERICAGCAYCVTACPYNTRYIDEETKVAKVITSVCDGCGACVTACPSGAAQVISTHQKQIISMLDELPMNLDEKDY